MFDKKKQIDDFKNIKPFDWKKEQYKNFIVENEIDKFYFDFYNIINKSKSLGFRIPIVEESRISIKSKVRNCKNANCTEKAHLRPDIAYAKWRCKNNHMTGAPSRYAAYTSYVPRVFDISNKAEAIKQIRYLAKKARTWYFEQAIVKNEYRGLPIYPEHKMLSSKSDNWEMRNKYNLLIDFDAKKDNTGNRHDFFGDKQKVMLSNAQNLMNTSNAYLLDILGIKNNKYEWWFSGNGLYLVLNADYLNEVDSIVGESNLEFFEVNCNSFVKESIKLADILNDNKIKYLEVDEQTQFVRSYKKTPFSLHLTYDRISIPLTAFFGKNLDIDLQNKEWIEYTYPKNITPEFVKELSSKIDIDLF